MIEYIVDIIVLVFTFELIGAYIVYPLKRGKSWYKLRRHTSWVFDKNCGYFHRKNLTKTSPTPPRKNAPRKILFPDFRTGPEGFVFTEKISDIKDKKLIFCIGGSTTAGIESRYGKTYPQVLDSLLTKDGYRVINAGVGGYRSIHELLMFKHKILKYKPSMIILFSGYNDFEDCALQYDLTNPFEHCLNHEVVPRNRYVWYLSNVFLFQILRNLLYLVHSKYNIRTDSFVATNKEKLNETLHNRKWVEVWKKNIAEIIQICSVNNIECCILSHVSPIFPAASDKDKQLADTDLDMAGRYDIFLNYLQIIEHAAQETARLPHARYLDLGPAFEKFYCENLSSDASKRYKLFTDRMHFTEDGNRVLASIIYEQINEYI